MSIDIVDRLRQKHKAHEITEDHRAGEIFKEAADEIERLRSAFKPRFWTQEQSDAWHSAIPDVILAFEQLRDATPSLNEAAPHQVTAWHPIETAPKDGTLFLAFDSFLGTVIATFLDGTFIVACDGYATGDPTHWQPLPAPPEKE